MALIRHDAAHVLATAVLDLYPGVKISIGPAIDNGFYYDFEFPEGVTVNDSDFERIEAEMRRHIDADEPFVREDVSPEAALARFRCRAAALQGGADRGPAARRRPRAPAETCRCTPTARSPTCAVARIRRRPSGSRRSSCSRSRAPTGAATPAGRCSRACMGRRSSRPRSCAAYLEQLERARANDHRRLGPQLGLFTFSDTAPGSAFWFPAGTQVFNSFVALSREMGLPRGYTEVKTPILFDRSLWETSGHWEKYREHMFTTVSEDRPMALKPMNCPGHCQLYLLRPHSYRDLPVRYSEPGPLHRNEPSGTLHGLLRTRQFIQDDGHIFCTEDQIQDEVAGVLEFAFATYAVFGLDVRLELSTRPEVRIGSDELWDRSELALRNALEQHGLEYALNEGDGAFYGPKIDMHMTDSLGRSWQLGTCQLDYNFPERFELTYTGADNAEHRPVMIHRALMGSYERFIGILLEHLAGELPVWLAPVQAIVLPISDRHLEYARVGAGRVARRGRRPELDDRTESVGRKIRDAELRKIPYMLVVGDREAESGEVQRPGTTAAGDAGAEPVSAFGHRVVNESKTRFADRFAAILARLLSLHQTRRGTA